MTGAGHTAALLAAAAAGGLAVAAAYFALLWRSVARDLPARAWSAAAVLAAARFTGAGLYFWFMARLGSAALLAALLAFLAVRMSATARLGRAA